MKRLIIFALIVAAVIGLCVLGLKKDESSKPAPVTVTARPESEVPATIEPVEATPEYNSIDKADKEEIGQVKQELLRAAEACRDVYAAADKGTAWNVVLSEDVIEEMVWRIGSLGFPAVDAMSTLDMVSPEPIVEFGMTLNTGLDTAVSYYTVYPDGQISVYRLTRQSGQWYLIAMSAVWDKDCEPSIPNEGRYVMGDVKYTDKGWLIYSRNTESFDDNQKSNTSSYVFVRVLPYDSEKRALAEKYIAPVGYFENNLFTTSWKAPDYTVIDFNSLYSQLFGMYMGTEPLSDSNASNYYSNVEGTKLYLIPTDSFETVVQTYFNIDSKVLRSISDYSADRGGYYFYGYSDGIYNTTPRIPEPEVVDYRYNSDGSITIRVDAVNRWYGTDRAFSHEVTVYDNGKGNVKYTSNTLYTDSDSILPQQKLSDQLNMEKAKIR